MMLIIGVILICVLAVAILSTTKPSDSSPQVARQSMGPMFVETPFVQTQVPQLGPQRPEASAWSKQVAVDMLNEVVVAEEREKVLGMLRRAIQPETAPAAKASK